MRNFSIVLAGSLVLVAAVTVSCGEPEQPPAPPTPSRTIDSEAISRFATAYMDEKNIPGMAAAIVADGAVAWSGGWGWSDIAAGRPMTADTIINIASITKTVTNAAVLQLRDEGLFDLDDPVNDYLPFEVVHSRYPNTPITFRHLLTHTAALGDGDAYDASYACGDPQVSLADWLEGYFTPGGPYYDAEQNFLEHEPGEKYNYSNLGYGLLGHLVEVISGQSLSDYTRVRLFEPLGMTSTGWMLADVDADLHATPYAWVSAGDVLNNLLFADRNGETVAEDGFVPFCRYSFYNLSDGLVRTSVHELSRFLLAHMNGGELEDARILEAGTIGEIFVRQLDRERLDDWEGVQGLTWRRRDIVDGPAWEHSGADPGVRTRMLFSADEGIGVVVFANRVANVQPVVEFLFAEAQLAP
jgi:CubicO group peptidase (beta-lactamase class C family)